MVSARATPQKLRACLELATVVAIVGSAVGGACLISGIGLLARERGSLLSSRP